MTTLAAMGVTPLCREPDCTSEAHRDSKAGLCGYHDPAVHDAILHATSGWKSWAERESERACMREHIRELKFRGQWKGVGR